MPDKDRTGELRGWTFTPTRETIKLLVGYLTTEDAIVRRLLRRLGPEPFRVQRKVAGRVQNEVAGRLPSHFPVSFLKLDRRRGRRPEVDPFLEPGVKLENGRSV